MERKTTLVCILDGFGLNPERTANAVALARTPTFDRIFGQGPKTTLTTHGLQVGLPEGQMGNSEVGHLNIGAGRVVEQWLVRINRELSSGSIYQKPEYRDFIRSALSESQLHIFGLFSQGGVHSHSSHLLQILPALNQEFPGSIALHIITDGRDTSPTLAAEELEQLQEFIKQFPKVQIATVCGRFYAMDRDKRWERVEQAYRVYEGGPVTTDLSPSNYIRKCYEQDVTDEFIPPVRFSSQNVNPRDSLLFFNFREDRMREIVAALCKADFPHFSRKFAEIPAERVLCFTEYDKTFGLPVLFEQIDIRDHLGETISRAGLKQLRVAETEKYPHVTYFLNGGIEIPYEGEDRQMVPSPRDVKTYDQKPEMSAAGVCEIVTRAILNQQYDLIIVNYANCDMVGHTGNLEAAIKAVETVDACLAQMLQAIDQVEGQAVIFADHGNAEQMLDPETGKPHTAHTTFPVPFIVYGRGDLTLRSGGALCDVAPTVLELMKLQKPSAMTGNSLMKG